MTTSKIFIQIQKKETQPLNLTLNLEPEAALA